MGGLLCPSIGPTAKTFSNALNTRIAGGLGRGSPYDVAPAGILTRFYVRVSNAVVPVATSV